MKPKQEEQANWNAFSIADQWGPEAVAIGSTAFFFTLLFMGGILASGVMLGLVTSLGLGIILWECRTFAPLVYNFIIQHPFGVDIFTSVLFFGLMGMSVNGLIASAVFSICNSNILLLCNRYDPRAQDNKVRPIASIFDFVKSKFKRNGEPIKTEHEVQSTVINAEWRAA